MEQNPHKIFVSAVTSRPFKVFSMRSVRLASLLLAALAAAVLPAEGAILISIDKSAQRMTVEVDGAPRWTWPVSTGRRGYGTPNGSYKAFRLEKDHFSKEW